MAGSSFLDSVAVTNPATTIHGGEAGRQQKQQKKDTATELTPFCQSTLWNWQYREGPGSEHKISFVPGHMFQSPGQQLSIPTQFSGESRLEDPATFIQEFQRLAIPGGWITDAQKYQVLENLLVGPALDWFKELTRDNMPFYANDNHCFVKVFNKRFLTEARKTELQEAFYARVQAPGELGEDYIMAKMALWQRTAPEEVELTTEQLMSIKRGLQPHNGFFIELQKPKTIEDLRTAVRMADHYKKQPQALPEPLTGVTEERQAYKSEPAMKHPINAAFKTTSSLERRVDELAIQLEKLVDLQQKMVDQQGKAMTQARPMTQYETPHQRAPVICYNCDKTGHIAAYCRSPCGNCGDRRHPATQCPEPQGRRNGLKGRIEQESQQPEAQRSSQDFLEGRR